MQCCENRCCENFEERYQVIIKNIGLGAGGFFDNIPPSIYENTKNIFQRRFIYDFNTCNIHQKYLKEELKKVKKIIKNENYHKTRHLINFLYNTCYEINRNLYNDIFEMGIELIRLGKENYLRTKTTNEINRIPLDIENDQIIPLKFSSKNIKKRKDFFLNFT